MYYVGYWFYDSMLVCHYSQAESAVQQKEEELEQLREVINKLINEAGARTRQEVKYNWYPLCSRGY